MELEKIAASLAMQNPKQAQKLDKELERLHSIMEETGTEVLANMEKARYRKEKDLDKIKELRRIYRLLRKEIESIEACREQFGSVRRAAALSKESRERIDYEQYRVDETVAYSLGSVITNKKPAGFSIGGVRYEAGSWKQVLLLTCAALNRMDPMLFASLERDPELQGRRRPYFSGNGDGLDTPAKVPDADVFVETHVSARYLTKMLRRLLRKFSIPESEYRIYLRKDFTVLHQAQGGNEPGGGRLGGLQKEGAGQPMGAGSESEQGFADSGIFAENSVDNSLGGQLTLADWDDGDWEE